MPPPHRGGGPTGLVLALWLSHLGVKVRIVDKAAEPGTTSRALAVHARILEFYDQIDLAREIVDPGLKMGAATLWVAGKEKGRIVFGDMGQGISPFPYALIFPQDEHERPGIVSFPLATKAWLSRAARVR